MSFLIPFEFILWEFFALLQEVPHETQYVLYTIEVLYPHLIYDDVFSITLQIRNAR
jgi:hypothetical protein